MQGVWSAYPLYMFTYLGLCTVARLYYYVWKYDYLSSYSRGNFHGSLENYVSRPIGNDSHPQKQRHRVLIYLLCRASCVMHRYQYGELRA